MSWHKLTPSSVYLRFQNRKKERAAASGDTGDHGLLTSDFMDLTDKEHPDFRYVF